MRRMAGLVVLMAMGMMVLRVGNAETHAGAAEISADLGPCSALVTVTGADAQPIYGAKMTTRVQYGFLGVKKLDLEAFTAVDGKVKITGLPESLKKPMVIHVSHGGKSDEVEFKPDLRCHANFDVQLH